MAQQNSLISILGSWALLAMLGASSAAISEERVTDPFCADQIIPERAFRKVIDHLVQSETLVIDGPEWDDVLISNCLIHDVDGDGITIRNVKNLTILGCNIRNTSGNGIRLRSSGSTDGVHIINNTIVQVGKNGISAAKRWEKAIDHTEVLLLGNTIKDSGLSGERGRQHGIYSQVSDVRITGNIVTGTRAGNGISIRSSGVVTCNFVDGISKGKKPGIRYYPDHKTGPSRMLEIRNNQIMDAAVGIDLHAESATDTFLDKDLVRHFRIIDNFVEADIPVRIHSRWQSPEFEVIVSGSKTITP